MGRGVAVGDRLYQVAMGLFAERGYDAVTTAEIASAAEVSQRTFFRHFPSKMDILLRDSETSTDEFFVLLDRQPAELSVREALVSAVAHQMSDPRELADSARMLTVVRGASSLQDFVVAYQRRFEDRLAAWIAVRVGADPGDISVQAAAAMLAAARRVTLDVWAEQGFPADGIQIVEQSVAAARLLG